MNFSQWLTFALLTPFLWAMNNVLDRAMITRLIKNEYALTFVAGLTRLPFFLILLSLSGWYIPETRILLLTLLTGFLTVLPIIFYFKALEKADTPNVILLYDASNPLFVFFISALFVGERLSGFDGIGFFLLLSAGILSSLKLEKKLRITKQMLWIIAAALFWAPADVLFDYLIPHYPSLSTLLGWDFAGSFFGAFLLFLSPEFRKRTTAWQDYQWPKLGWMLFLMSTLIGFLAQGTFLKALELGSVSLTVVTTNVQPLFVFLFDLLLFQFFSRRANLFERVNTGWKSLLPKGIALVFIFSGVWFLYAN